MQEREGRKEYLIKMTTSQRSRGQETSTSKHGARLRIIKRALRFVGPHIWPLVLFFFLVLSSSIIAVLNPLIYRDIINHGIMEHRAAVVVQFAVLAGLLALIDAGLGLWQTYVSAKVGNAIVLSMRKLLFEHIQRMSLGFFAHTQTGALISRLNNDVAGARSAFTGILSSVTGNITSILLVLGAMFILSWQITIASLILLPIFVMPARQLARRLKTIVKESYDIAASLNSFMVERFNVSGALVMKFFGCPQTEIESFGTKAERASNISIKRTVYGRLFVTALVLVSSLATVFVYGWGGVLAVKGTLDLGSLVALATYLNRLNTSLSGLSNIQVTLATTIVSFERLFEVLDLKPMIVEKLNPVEIKGGQSTVSFEHVFFRYPAAADVSLSSLETTAVLDTTSNTTVLHDITFTARPGEIVALVGPSGAGKTTIAQLIARLYDPQSGVVRINGIDLREAKLETILDRIGMVAQEAYLFHDTIRANLLYAKPGATDPELWKALSAAQISPLIESLPNGLDTIVGERGYCLSGGEKQRISIARLLLKAPDIVILDEATAHLDSESEAAMQTAIEAVLRKRTSIVIAHRLSTILHADQILVIGQGQIVERGTHPELVARGGLYADLYRRQFGEGIIERSARSTVLGA